MPCRLRVTQSGNHEGIQMQPPVLTEPSLGEEAMLAPDFQSRASRLVEWVQDYFSTLADQPVRSQASVGALLERLPREAPSVCEDAEAAFNALLADLDTLIMPGITHWQHPRFFAYFPANARPESQLAEIIMAAMGVNSMLWETSPAATELEVAVCAWLSKAMGLPDSWLGLIQDTASSATFAAVVAAREKALEGHGNKEGLFAAQPLGVYVSGEAHSSIEKAARMAGLGSASVRKIAVDETLAMRPDALKAAIEADLEAGVKPALLVVTSGGTSRGGFDRASKIITIAKQYDIYTHVDAAWAGSAMLLEEQRELFTGVEQADSFVFNPHKWLGIGFDCSVQFLKSPEVQGDALRLKPRYLQTEAVQALNAADRAQNTANNRMAEQWQALDLSDYSPVLGRRPRALKIWFVLRLVGLDALKEMMRSHIKWAEALAALVTVAPGFELVGQVRLSLLLFRYQSDAHTEALLRAVNDDGFCYLTPTLVDGKPAIRFQIGSWRTRWRDVEESWQRIRAIASTL